MAEGRIVRRGAGDRLDVLGDEMRLLAVGEGTGRRFDFMIGTFSYLSGPPLHTHRDQDDTFYVLDGVLSVLDLGFLCGSRSERNEAHLARFLDSPLCPPPAFRSRRTDSEGLTSTSPARPR